MSILSFFKKKKISVSFQMDKECLSLAEQAKEGVRTHIKRGFSLPVPLQVQLRTTPSSPNRQEVPPMLRDSGLASSMATSSTASTSRLGDELTQRCVIDAVQCRLVIQSTEM